MRGIGPHWRAFPALVFAVALLFPTLVSGSQQVTVSGGVLSINGDDSSEKVTLSRSGSNVVVQGFFTGASPAECTVLDPNKEMRCPTSAFDSIAIDMGGAKDTVIVKDTLTLPVTAKLGGAADSFTGAGENDTCMGQGGRDACSPGAGDDICIGGGDRDSCVMGPGEDRCNLGSGNDDCTGDSGPDTCKGGDGVDLCVGTGGNDMLDGGPGKDGEKGGGGRDRCDPTPGPDAVHSCEVILP